MSLNGLDDSAIIESYQAALTEAGGWFLLKYVARDVVALLARGSGGVAEIRITIDSYEEKAPLYGFLQYRRRKVILRYVPEGVSRILQARISVQFQSVLDKFSPHDTVFSLSAPYELTENALSSACFLHTASRSMTPSSSSIRHFQLGEITEDAEVEENASVADQSVAANSLGVPSKRDSVYSRTSEATAVPDRYRPGESQASSVAETASIHSARFSENPEKPLPLVPLEHTKSHPIGSTQRHILDHISHPISERRSSTQSSRPSIRDLEYAGSRPPKVKLGPRPVVDINGRPRTAGSMGRSREQRPVAALPAGVRPSTRKSNPSRPKSQPGFAPQVANSRLPPVPTLLPPPVIMSFSRIPPASPKSIKSVASSIGLAPEKQRLMKALELRKRQMEKQAQQAAKQQLEKTIEESETTVPEEKTNAVVEICVVHNPDVSTSKSEDSVESSQALSNAGDGDTQGDKLLVAEQSKLDSAVDLSIAECPTKEEKPITTLTSDNADGPPLPPSETLESDTATSSTSAIDQSNCDTLPSAPDVQEVTPTDESSVTNESNSTVDLEIDTDVKPCEIEIPSDLECPDTPTPRAIPVEISQMAESESEVSDKEQGESFVSGEDASQTGVKTPSIHDVNPEQGADEPVDENSEKQRKQKRRAMLEPIHIPLRTDDMDDDQLLSDDSFMEELKSATVQEAKPVAVPKTPLSPFPSNGEVASSELWKGSRVVSNASAGGVDVQALPVGRSTSPYLASQTPVPVLVAKKVNVSSGISKRIKALEMFSSRDSSQSQTPVVPSSASSSPFEKFRKRTSMTPSPTPTPKANKAPSPQEQPVQHTKRQEPSPPTESMKVSNSVSVTARIIRDPAAPPLDPPADPSEPSVLNLQQSQLTVQHDGERERNTTSPLVSPPTRQDKKRWSISSIGSKHAPDSAPLRRSDSTTSKLSLSKHEPSAPRISTDTFSHLDSVDEALEDKKESRKSRLMRRMSAITSNSRRGIINALSPALKEETSPTPPREEEEEPSLPEAPQVVDIGEVNVQFPDTLLWKRRFMRIDDNGYLVLTPGTIDGSARNVVKRYHLSEFRKPTLPDQDRQELPNSIVLDFKNGSTLQCACESRNGQKAVFQTLLEAHKANKQR